MPSASLTKAPLLSATAMDERTRRIAQNEALFREINKSLEQLNDRLSEPSEPFMIVCECGDETCVSRISLSPLDYQELRADATQFAVVPGHEVVDVETVAARREGYNVVRKRPGAPAAIAEATDF
jgi:hypothetical protein